MGASMMAIAAVPALPAPVRVPAVFALTGLMGLFGGLFLIPVESFIQVRPAPERKGAVLAAVNFVVFTGILISGLVSNALNAALTPTSSFGLIGVVSAAIGVALLVVYKRMEKS
jgi:hypothetical protein